MVSGIREAEGAARKIFSAADCQVPVNVVAIAESKGIVVKVVELQDDISGMLAVRGDRAVMHINSSHHQNRQRFSMAHELGHFMLHRSNSDLFVDAFHRDDDSSKGIDPEEIQANAFAAELLMPEKLLRAKLRAKPLDIFDEKAVKKLAAEFGVSAQAITIRLTRLNLVSF